MNLLIIANYFAPMNSVGAQRPNAWARYWPSFGSTVTVLTSRKREAITDGFFPAGVSVVDVNWHGKSREINSRQTSKPDSPRTMPDKKLGKNIIKYVVDVHRWLKRKFFCNYLDSRSLWILFAYPVACKIIKSKNIQVVVSTSPAYPVHVLARKLKKKFPELIWMADYRDLWSGNPMFPGSAIVRKIEMLHEKRVMRYADIVTTISEPLAKYLGMLLNRTDVNVYYNGYEKTDVIRGGGSDIKNGNTFISIVYTGSVLPGLHNPEPLFAAISHLHRCGKIDPAQLKIMFYGDATAIRERVCNDTVLCRYVELIGSVSRHEALNAQASADALLFLGARQNGGAATDGVVSGKIFEYMTSGTEVIAIGVTPDMSVGQLIGRSRIGDIYSNDVELISCRIERLVCEGKVKLDLDYNYICNFRRDVQAKEIHKLIVNKSVK